MSDVGVSPASLPISHTSTTEWQSFEIRMRKRRAQRCVLRAEVALEAGFEDDARAALEEARRLDSFAPDFDTLRKATQDRQRIEAAALQREQLRRSGLYAAVAVITLAVGSAPLVMGTRSVGVRQGPSGSVGVQGPAGSAVPQGPSGSVGVQGAAGSVVPQGPTGSAAAATDSKKSAALDDAARQRARTERERVAIDTSARRDKPLPPVSTPPQPDRRALAQPAGIPQSDSQPALAIEPPPVSLASGVTELPGTPTAPATGESSAPPTPDDRGVRSTLARYESAYSTLNAGAVRSVWPGVDERSLARAFDSLDSQRVALGRCSISINGGAATAACNGSATWTPKVGGGTRTEPRRWQFELANNGGAWQIVAAEAR